MKDINSAIVIALYTMGLYIGLIILSKFQKYKAVAVNIVKDKISTTQGA